MTTTIYERHPVTGPGTHVLAIGVGKYPYLLGGTERLANKPLGLGQLSSPPVSAKSFIEWCLAPLFDPKAVGLTNPLSPLASVEALVSAKRPVIVQTPAGAKQLEGATRRKIKQAFSLWLDRVKSNASSVAVFYFCGHGIMVADDYLLAEDFGNDNDEPWKNAFDISNTLRAVERETRSALYFLIDACREISVDVALNLGGNPTALKVADLKKSVICASTSVIRATGEKRPAFGDKGKVSRFTEALLTALSGYCGTRGVGSVTWDIDGEALAAAVRKLLEAGNRITSDPQESSQEISGASIPLVWSTATPQVKVALDLLPCDLRALARMYLRSAKGHRYEHDGRKGIYHTDVPRGFYSVGARATANQFVPVLHEDQDLCTSYNLVMQAQP